MSDRFDQILKQALARRTRHQTPRLNQKILNQVKEREEMKKRRKWVPGIVFSFVLVLAAGSGSWPMRLTDC